MPNKDTGQMTPAELARLATRLGRTTGKKAREDLVEAFLVGFYGHALPAVRAKFGGSGIRPRPARSKTRKRKSDSAEDKGRVPPEEGTS